MKYLLDTNVISELVAKRPDSKVLDWLDSLDPEDVYLSVITIGELRKGIEKLPASKRKTALLEWLSDDLLVRFSGRVLTLDLAVMLVWGKMTGQAKRPLPALDSLIAALALHHNCSVASRNESDFKDTGVTVVNPWK